ncbi:hypothetical protein [Embleya sp. NBC_00896]|uniref:hypothetical protein n=1 Tax=Embleya sp. NBC_00896 TaxID=2975961 RepID=UPI00386DBE19|nr:hypothetical protein OG928_18650 [Embleya sp. NBC_00896]
MRISISSACFNGDLFFLEGEIDFEGDSRMPGNVEDGPSTTMDGADRGHRRIDGPAAAVVITIVAAAVVLALNGISTEDVTKRLGTALALGAGFLLFLYVAPGIGRIRLMIFRK